MAPVPFLVFFALFNPLLLCASTEDGSAFKKCLPFNCGKLGEIWFPFTKNTSPEMCGPCVVDGCNENSQRIQLVRGGKWFELHNISQAGLISITDEELRGHLNSNSCDSFNNLSLPPSLPYLSIQEFSNLTLFKCDPSVNFPHRLELNYTGCNNFSIYYTRNTSLPSPPPTCSILQLPVNNTESYGDIFRLLTATFSIEVSVLPLCYHCYLQRGECKINKGNLKCIHSIEESKKLRLNLGLAVGIGVLIITICCVIIRKYSSIHFLSCWRKTRGSQSMEAFLRNYGTLAPKRYSYSELKKMTKNFKEKLGQGGYGSVFKGNLLDGRLVAVKVLKKSKSNGEEFVNEVSSIGMTSHVNIVTLLGFCFEGPKRALIYEFMSNGSLDKHIYEENLSKAQPKLGWETLYQIAVGIARGLEYLHRGCNTRILHFDIKPHNILLDENFCPKISDFGLAKICPGKESIVSMLGARGTAGYIAPEVFCRNFGGVSHKSDVYSYGMLVLEMIGGRKNFRVGVDNTSEIYFPHWIYKRLEIGEELQLRGAGNEVEEENARKMILASLWCIQTDPSNRPPMSRVVDMLQGSLESLPIPPKPYLSSPPRPPHGSNSNSNS
ncbi:LEAF RUST 10 DISEASE-RESISTANCE LOCUS RECEPTOR-LIKE PROTEIN KINASE-like 2.1 isoform X5 [Populus trichocarpa]|uniref:LEAF RUST 10 DISEASE-RESISTANCE LOCUS RECEPTOR-LIKE PROTEIN KINASE-like 2.1 isoform X5 n=1 Tax=Populus trichocarpa TaxID=3694 RepID=UPI0022796B1E|nr:LEAF RUST 10 DISEASE-RESISTANCE LOCUS RECEPTOR-LIKE PROTEIN KINASE-like 2.1 isoform X5 [Populus trichocarpa]